MEPNNSSSSLWQRQLLPLLSFLCGLLIGRGIPVAQSDRNSPELVLDIDGDLTTTNQSRRAVESSNQADSDKELTYHQRLESNDPIAETLSGEARNNLKPNNNESNESVDINQRSILDEEVSLSASSKIPAREIDSISSDAGKNISAEPMTAEFLAGSGYTVQVAALRVDEAAQQIADRLVEKGFPAYVLLPAEDAPVAVYRVRVGRYIDRSDAERMFERLVREEQFKPWITR